ncbi:WecB/TagA/CpsF family glycosyltransferase [Rhodococcus rhodochrous]|uniref:WecB/TagA/CpsF family glycosyltransferase n=1 Tax=Rhodococcus rhodochrous TaxID=1829 RepID=UPI001E2C5227|nr:WecB/TagA/CpsF family glycosyltransferase [Rhodococcus rhodochrous]MCD2100066.1 WecB/TagA/CpsF family glycosyltransferase [Rhodococcus rhodochrous]MCD2124478.1 WecB/TagA/CpsF family glycosyltransferase [Rhodococcus rhodochrous]MCQ4137385.1 WecB/TagA/CpsF family glycosyltransferase [Rhodococcus rhodochrous]MDJ0021233.1 WecB/TagA/CpsF family glycosyltransferase [Rhodococcus rhodochrous]
MREIAVEKTTLGDGVEIAGVPLFIGSSDDLLDEIDKVLRNPSPSLLMTLNVDQVLELEKNPTLFNAFRTAAIRTIDGVPLQWLSRKVAGTSVHRNTGADLLEIVTDKGRERAWRIAIAGGAPGVADEAAEKLKLKYGGASVEAVEFPRISGPDGHATRSVIASFERGNFDLVFLCLGCPKQETWFLENRQHLPAGVYIGAGAAVDFSSGRKKRAPQVLQNFGLEWFWRMAAEPSRLWRRYLVRGPMFVKVIARSLSKKGQ